MQTVIYKYYKLSGALLNIGSVLVDESYAGCWIRIDASRYEMDMIVADSNSDMYNCCMCWLYQRMNRTRHNAKRMDQNSCMVTILCVRNGYVWRWLMMLKWKHSMIMRDIIGHCLECFHFRARKLFAFTFDWMPLNIAEHLLLFLCPNLPFRSRQMSKLPTKYQYNSSNNINNITTT